MLTATLPDQRTREYGAGGGKSSRASLSVMTSQAGQVVFTRGGVTESVHTVHVAVVNGAGEVVASCGDAGLVTFPRSSSKPVQALPLALAAPELPGDELALACASHAGMLC